MKKQPKLGNTNSWLDKLYDLTYDFVYSEGDAALQFTADLIRGRDEVRASSYTSRQLERNKQKGEKPLTSPERIVFDKIARRYPNEKIIEYWKRKKMLLNHPDKAGLVAKYMDIEKQRNKLSHLPPSSKQQAQQQKIEREFQKISTPKSQTRHRQK